MLLEEYRDRKMKLVSHNNSRAANKVQNEVKKNYDLIILIEKNVKK